MIVPLQQDGALLADVEAARRAPAGSLHLWWLGQSGFLVQYAGRHLLFDPYLSDALTAKYADTATPHVRMTARVVDPARLDVVDVVTSSHRHTDHLDAATLVPLLTANPSAQLVLPEANRVFAAARLGVEPLSLVGLGPGEPRAVEGFVITTVPAAHEEVTPETVGFVVQAGPWRVYHAGDTLRYPGMAERLRPYAVDVALLPINGRAPERRVAGNLDGREAAELARAIDAAVAVPCHYEMFTFNTAPPTQFVETCAALQQPCAVLRAGERLTLARPRHRLLAADAAAENT